MIFSDEEAKNKIMHPITLAFEDQSGAHWLLQIVGIYFWLKKHRHINLEKSILILQKKPSSKKKVNKTFTKSKNGSSRATTTRARLSSSAGLTAKNK
jgi:hypothetical protein